MQIWKISLQILILTCFYLIGTWIQQLFHLFIPGSIIGMLLLFLVLVTKKLPTHFIEDGSTFILKHMPLLFLPVTVGVLQFLDLFAGAGILLIIIAIISTVIVMVTVGYLGQYLVNKKEIDRN